MIENTQPSHAIAVKAMIENSTGEILVLQRSNNAPHQPGKWDIPGGRIDPGESPFEALERECIEEAGINVTIGKPIGVNHFTRDDGQVIVMIIFYCVPIDEHVTTSDEHEQYQWVDHNQARELLPDMGHSIEYI